MKVSRTLILIAAGVGGLAVIAPASAQEPSPGPMNAGDPTASVAGPTRVVIQNVRFVGVTAVNPGALRWLLHDQFNKPLSYDDLQAMAEKVTRYYRKNAYFLARAALPVQDLSSGILEIHVTEGRVGKVSVRIAEDAPVSESRVQAMLEPLRSQSVLNNRVYERTMLLISDLPGVRANATLEEGSESGTTDIKVEISAKKRWQVAVDADNDGTKATGRERAGLTARWGSPSGNGDNLDVRVQASSDASLAFGRIAYELPVGYDGWRAGAGIAHVQYDLGGQYSVLDAEGKADVANVFATYPIHRSRNENALLRLNVEYKSLNDDIKLVGLESRKHLLNVSAATNYEARDAWGGGGFNSHAMSATWGRLTIEDDITRYFDQSAFGRQTEGNYLKLNFQLSRLQYLFARNNLFLGVAGQVASKNLDPAEQLNIGGAGTVRAYANSELLADTGIVANLEWRIGLTRQFTLFPYYDLGHGSVFERVAGANDGGRTISGYGVGLTWSQIGNFFITTSVAWRDKGEPPLAEGSDHEPRWLFQLQKSF
ncbi:ShlB/FhaC/HecB family hemolysin secretion/activation protein [Hydrocarboniphaga sp.]|uniref:ShlB/FhaC/HecB family hemolysin secretion/activation protein n=1 Tax=Hydrocarboniphaga sp. TaxID=2033016 RepID=UPI002ABC5C39|nr:ShlB/FhaC/HecB family hemolysin secretion/activation protein [Hydrocarboniphaga sp.]MDZ4080649.1 ShlB/FhaC/HecB family hemolysin secretion/activation protein [Hydrocarboniphaga sp.]